MKFDVFKWTVVAVDTWLPAASGVVRVNCTDAVQCWLQHDGFAVLAGVGHSFDLEVSPQVEFCLRSILPDTECFSWSPTPTYFDAPGEVFTNLDRKPSESGTLLEVKRALRLHGLEQLALRKEMKRERDELARERLKHAATFRPSAAPADPVVSEDAV